jgi:hypothetical protein
VVTLLLTAFTCIHRAGVGGSEALFEALVCDATLWCSGVAMVCGGWPATGMDWDAPSLTGFALTTEMLLIIAPAPALFDSSPTCLILEI